MATNDPARMAELRRRDAEMRAATAADPLLAARLDSARAAYPVLPTDPTLAGYCINGLELAARGMAIDSGVELEPDGLAAYVAADSRTPEALARVQAFLQRLWQTFEEQAAREGKVVRSRVTQHLP